MKIALASDLHIEFWKKPELSAFENTSNADILILAGDVLVQKNLNNLCFEFFDYITNQYKDIIYILGNHEFYSGDINKTLDILKEKLKYSNLHILNNEMIFLQDKTFFGGTMWTSCNNKNPITMRIIEKNLNDFNFIFNKDQEFSTEYSVELHNDFINKLKECLEQTESLFVISHHSPTYKTINPKYSDFHLNSAYATDLSELILDNPKIKYWVHGHLHNRIEIQIGDCLIACNAFGYVGYENIKDFQLKIIEI